MKIGILDIQGSVGEHLGMLERVAKAYKDAAIQPILVKNSQDLKGLRGLIIPGGESTTLSKLLKKFELFQEIQRRAKAGMAVWGTCAGAILMANEIKDAHQAESLGLMDVVIARNAYGRQLDSFETFLDFFNRKIPAVFIRAPKILKIGKGVEVLAKNGDEIVAVRQGKFLMTMFHPELAEDLSVYEYFLGMCAEKG